MPYGAAGVQGFKGEGLAMGEGIESIRKVGVLEVGSLG